MLYNLSKIPITFPFYLVGGRIVVMKFLLLITTLSIASFASLAKPDETFYSEKFCEEIWFGQSEFPITDKENNETIAEVDCLTDKKSIEFGWSDGDIYNDIGQALYYSIKTGLPPVIILLIDIENYEEIIKKTKRRIKKFEEINEAFNLNIELILQQVPKGEIISKEDLK